MENKCSKCGGKAEIVVKAFESDFPKEIFYCRKCLKESLNQSLNETLHINLNFWSMVNSKPRIAVEIDMESGRSLTFLNENLKSMFGVELTDEEKRKYEILRLRNAIFKAIKNENYELAGILQREIKRLRSLKKAK